MENLAKQLIKYFKTLGIEVYTNTKARGHQGFFIKNRIDISKNTKEDRIIPTLLHEFAHFIHNKLEPDMLSTGGCLKILFKLEGKKTGRQEGKQFYEPALLSSCPLAFKLSTIQNELQQITHFVDDNSLCHRLKSHKEQVKRKIKLLENQIREDYPNFMRSKKFKEFDKYIKKSKAKYLLKYDRVKFISPHILKFLSREEIFSIDNIEHDFPDMPRAFCAYIRLKSAQKKQARISKRINYLNKYYSKPTELFARFIEGIYINPEKTREIAPLTCERFFELLEQGYYFELKEVLNLLKDIIKEDKRCGFVEA